MAGGDRVIVAAGFGGAGELLAYDRRLRAD
jgi:hypothetical protein